MKPNEYITVVLEENLPLEERNRIIKNISEFTGVLGVQYTNVEEEKQQSTLRKQEVLDKLKNFYDNMSDEEFKARMEKAGFEVVEGKPGQLFVEEE